MAYANETGQALRLELGQVLDDGLVIAERAKDLARQSAIQRNGVRKASDDQDYERTCHLVETLGAGRTRLGTLPHEMGAEALVEAWLASMEDPLKDYFLPPRMLREIEAVYRRGEPASRAQLVTRYHEDAEAIRRPPKPPFAEGFLETYDARFAAFLTRRKESDPARWTESRLKEARTLAARAKSVAERTGNRADLVEWIAAERTAAGASCSRIIRDRTDRYDDQLEEEYSRASAWSGSVSLVYDFLTGG